MQDRELIVLKRQLNLFMAAPPKVSPGVLGGSYVESVWELGAINEAGRFAPGTGTMWISNKDAYNRALGLYFANKSTLFIQHVDAPAIYARYTITGVVAVPTSITLTLTTLAGAPGEPGRYYLRGEV